MKKPAGAGDAAIPDPIAEALKPCRNAIFSAAGFSLFINLLMLTGPLFMMQVYDRVLASRSIPTLVSLVILIALLYAIMGALELVRSRILVRVGRWLDESLSDRIYRAVVEQGLRRGGGLGAQPVRDLESLRQFVGGQGLFALFDAPWTPIYLGVVFLLHPLLGYFALGAGLVLLCLALLNEFVTRAPLGEANRAAQASGILAEDGRLNAEVIAALGMRDTIGRRWVEKHGEALTLQTRASDRGGMISGITKTLRLLVQSCTLALGAYLVIGQELSPGALIAGSIITSRALAPVEQVIANWQGFVNARRALERLRALISGLGARNDPLPLPRPQGALTVEGLTALLPGAEKPLLQGISFALQPGQGLGVIGPTGAGKSTLARVLVGIWPLMRGEVRLDGARLEQWSEEARGRFLGYLPQDVELFAGTVGENIARFEPEAEPAAIIDAARKADVHNLILSLPQGYDTAVGSGGLRLSAGQRQRIALARALYGGPALIVLDEPNSNLDSEGEEALVKAIATARGEGAIVIVIAHRPSAINAVDQLLFLRESQQVAFGPKEEVLRKVLKPTPDAVRQPGAVPQPGAQPAPDAGRAVAPARRAQADSLQMVGERA